MDKQMSAYHTLRTLDPTVEGSIKHLYVGIFEIHKTKLNIEQYHEDMEPDEHQVYILNHSRAKNQIMVFGRNYVKRTMAARAQELQA